MDGSGVDSFVRNRPRFLLYSNRIGNPSGLSNQTVLSIFEDPDSTLWIGTEGGGLNKLARNAKQFVQIKTGRDPLQSISNDHVTCINGHDRDYLWVGTKEGLNRFDRQHGTFQRYINPISPITGHNFINVIRTLSDGRFLLGTNSGLCYFDKGTGEFQVLAYKDEASLNYEAVESIWIEKPNIFCIGYLRSGLVRFNPDDSTCTHYRSDEASKNSLSDNFVQYIYQDRAGNFWIATRKGLNLLNKATGEFHLFTKTDGLPSNVVVGMLEDSDGNLWLSTTNGLSRFNVRDKPLLITTLMMVCKATSFGFAPVIKTKRESCSLVVTMVLILSLRTVSKSRTPAFRRL
jgi:ligand-binding sensor domain-containing protein